MVSMAKLSYTRRHQAPRRTILARSHRARKNSIQRPHNPSVPLDPLITKRTEMYIHDGSIPGPSWLQFITTRADSGLRPVKWGVRGRSPLRPDRLAGPFTRQHLCMRIQMSTASPLHWARGAVKGEQTPINGRPASGHGVFADSLSLDCSIGRVRLKSSKNSYPRVPGVTLTSAFGGRAPKKVSAQNGVHTYALL